MLRGSLKLDTAWKIYNEHCKTPFRCDPVENSIEPGEDNYKLSYFAAKSILIIPTQQWIFLQLFMSERPLHAENIY